MFFTICFLLCKKQIVKNTKNRKRKKETEKNPQNEWRESRKINLKEKQFLFLKKKKTRIKRSGEISTKLIRAKKAREIYNKRKINMRSKKIGQLFYSKIDLPYNSECLKKKDILLFSGPLGCNQIALKRVDPAGIGFFRVLAGGKSVCLSSQSKSFIGALSSLIQNKVDGVTRGFLTHLKIEGVGYRANLNERSLSLRVGFSHQVYFNVSPSVRIFLLDPTVICLYGIDKNQVFQTAVKIRSIRPPSPYKKRGIRFVDQTLVLKEGKRK